MPISPIIRDPNEPRKPVHVPVYPAEEKEDICSARHQKARTDGQETGDNTIVFDSRVDRIITALIAFGGLHHDRQERLYVSGTGFPHVCRINIDKLAKEQLDEVASVYADYLIEELRLDSFLVRHNVRHKYDFITTCDSRAQKLATAVQEVLKERRFDRPLFVVPAQKPPKGKTFLVVDAIRTGYTLAHAIRELTRGQVNVGHICSLFNYEYGGDETLADAETALSISPKHHFMVQRKDYEFFNRKHEAGGDPADRMLALIWEYQKGPIAYCVNRLHRQMCPGSRLYEAERTLRPRAEQGPRWQPQDMIIPVHASSDTSDEAARAGLERAILRLSIETACYPHEQTVWKEQEKTRRQDILLMQMAEIRKAYLDRYGENGTYWMAALGPLVAEAKKDAQGRGYNLNGSHPAHTRNVRDFFKLLLQHQPKIPYNIFGLLDVEKFKRGTDAYNAP